MLHLGVAALAAALAQNCSRCCMLCCFVLCCPTAFSSPPPPHCPPPAGIPLELIKPEALGAKVFEPLLLLGKQRWGFLDIRLRVKGGGHVSQVYGEYQGVSSRSGALSMCCLV